MSGIRFYEITPCCASYGTVPKLFNIIHGIVSDGVYKYTGTDQTINDITFKNGFCYTITEKGIDTSYYPVIDNYDLSPIYTDCNDQKCETCPEICFKLVNCVTEEVIYSTLQSLLQYVLSNQIVTLAGYEGCWQISISEEVCDCSVNVIVLKTFNSCQDCLPVIAYKFTNCDNQNLVKYSTEDFSDYVGKTVQLECGDCWSVTQIDYAPPSTQTIIIDFTFDNCVACKRTYYRLTNCNNSEDIIYTYSDLDKVIPLPINCKDCVNVSFTYDGESYSYAVPKNGENYYFTNGIYSFVIQFNGNWSLFISWNNGSETITSAYINEEDNECPIFNNWVFDAGPFEVENLITSECNILPIITIKGCDGCFTVEETREPIDPTTITLLEVYDSCEECEPPLPCLCNRITNYDTVQRRYTYIDCNDVEQILILQPNESSDKICLKNWTLTWPETDNLEIFGNCNESDKFNWICPITIPKRKVKPGYSTPSCDIEKYEKITCKSSEYYYKQVMRLRYGISNCCPEDEEQWLIKKELIDLDALRDPDYICQPVTSCCGQTINTCGCGCDQTPKTCNS